MVSEVAPSAYSLTAFPAAWSIARSYRMKKLSNPLDWFAATRLPHDIQDLVNTYETYVTHDGGLASLSNWVLDDLPRGRAHFIDSDTDAAWALLLLWSIKHAAAEGDAERIRIGPNTYATRERLREAIRDIGERSIDVAKDLKLRQFSSKVLPDIQRSIERAIREYASRERDELLAAEIDEGAIRRLIDAVDVSWRAGFPRRLLTEVGSVRRAGRAGPESSKFGLTATAPKVFFVPDENVVGDSSERIGEDLARAINQGEGNVLAQRLMEKPHSNYQGSLESRLRLGMRPMGVSRAPVTHCLVPLNWRLNSALSEIAQPVLNGNDRGEFTWTFDELTLIQWAQWRDPTMVFLSLPAAVAVDQFNNGGTEELLITYREIEQGQVSSEDEATEEPTVRIEAFERWRLRTRKSFIRRVALPPDLLED